MSPLTRYGFSSLVALYGLYQISQDHMLSGITGILLAALLLFLTRR
jgi:hypothetical protein